MLGGVRDWFNSNPWISNNAKYFIVIILAAISYYILKRIILPIIKRIIQSTPTQLDDILLSNKVLTRISFFAPLIVLRYFLYLETSWQPILKNVITILAVINFTSLCGAILNSINEFYEKEERHKQRPIKGFIQIVKMTIYIFGTILTIGIIVGRSPLEIIAGLGVFTAILALLFKDPILSFVASIQIASYDLVRVGDWIEVPKYSADGDVIDIALTVIKVQNGDKTITIIPTYKLIEDSFKNWRGMRTFGARRIKRSIFIDQSSVKFCSEEMLKRFEKIQLIKDYLKLKREEIKEYNKEKNVDPSNLANGRNLTNLGTFREYLKTYLLNHEKINKNFAFTVRQLQPSAVGIPIELYIFADTIDWVEYEDIQADIFDHILAVVPLFELCIFQHASGNDFKIALNN
jgi:miniconductance mechanosensitive channel